MFIPLKTTLNGRICNSIDLAGYTVDDVEYIVHIRKHDMRSAYDRARGINADNYPCCVEILLKPDRDREREFQTCTVIGYSGSIEFYHPVYDTPEKANNGMPDERTTLYWNPYMKTDPVGAATIEFYTNDTEEADYDITIEGLNPEGTAYRYRRQLCN